MSELPTIKVRRDGPKGYHIINLSGFDPARHEAYVDADAVQAGEAVLADLKVGALKDLAAERGVDLGDATRKADIIAALELHAEAQALLDLPHDDAGGRTIRELNADLTAKGIEIDPSDSPAEKLAQLQAAE